MADTLGSLEPPAHLLLYIPRTQFCFVQHRRDGWSKQIEAISIPIARDCSEGEGLQKEMCNFFPTTLTAALLCAFPTGWVGVYC